MIVGGVVIMGLSSFISADSSSILALLEFFGASFGSLKSIGR